MSEVVVDDGMTIHYDVFGRKDGTPLVMIQGLGTDSRGWALQRLAMGRQFRCITIDNRGVGRTGPAPEPYSLERMALDVVAVLDQERIDRAHVMGASMGGVIAQIVGVLHPDRTRSLVLACTACRHHEWRRELFEEWAEAVELRRDVRPRRRVVAVARRAAPPAPLRDLAQPASPGSCCSRHRARSSRRSERSSTRRTSCATSCRRSGCRCSSSPDRRTCSTPVGDAEELAELIPHAAPRGHLGRRARPDGGGTATGSTRRCSGSWPTSTRPTARSTSRRSRPDRVRSAPASPRRRSTV